MKDAVAHADRSIGGTHVNLVRLEARCLTDFRYGHPRCARQHKGQSRTSSTPAVDDQHEGHACVGSEMAKETADQLSAVVRTDADDRKRVVWQGVLRPQARRGSPAQL